ncbi:MAG TPA: hypothetical protein VM910_03465, partial [Bradyrhizobium sp.]|nr:hypothetical protein [Bradyrhizobium sp.]
MTRPRSFCDRLLRNPTTGTTACCPRRERPRGRAAEQRDELASPHSITSSARVSRVVGTLRPMPLLGGRH